MAPPLDPDHPPASSWIVAAVAGVLAVSSGAAFWWLAEDWAKDPAPTNLYTFVAAIGGVVIFEFLRFSMTVGRRHRRAVESSSVCGTCVRNKSRNSWLK